MAVGIAVASVIISVGAYYYAKSEADKAKRAAKKQQERARLASLKDARRVSRSSIESQRLIYGTARVGGQIVQMEAVGDNNENLAIVMVLATKRVWSIDNIYIGERGHTDSFFTKTTTEKEWVLVGDTYVQVDVGETVQYVTDDFTSGWRTDALPFAVANVPTWNDGLHKLALKPHVCVVLKYDDEIFQTGIPDTNALVRGHMVYDPRKDDTNGGTGSHRYGDESTWEWSDNWALCVAHYLMDENGAKVPPEHIDWVTVTASANISDEEVATGDRTINVRGEDDWEEEFIPAGTEKRYTLNGVITLDGRPLDIIAELEQAGAGRVFNAGGVWKIFAGVYDAPTVAFDENDLSGGISLVPGGSYREKANTVRGTYVDEDMGFQPTDFRVLTSDSYIEADAGEELAMDLTLAFTRSPFTARRIAKIEMERSRASSTVAVKMNYVGLKAQLWDTIVLRSERFGWTDAVTMADSSTEYGKVFRVVGFKFSPKEGVELELREELPSIYDWEEGDVFEVNPVPLTNLPNPYYIAPPAEVFSEETLYISANGGQIKNKCRVVWNTGDFSRSRYYELWWRKLTEPTFDWTLLIETSLNDYTVPDIEPGDYEFRVAAVNALGVRSGFATTAITVLGKTAPPADVTGFSYVFETSGVRFSWGEIPDIDRSNYELRVGETWDAGTLVARTKSLDYLWQYYTPGTQRVHIKAIDTSGNYSVDSATLDVSISGPAKVTGISARAIDNYSTLTWAAPASTYPIKEYIIRTGVTLAESREIGRTSGTFIPIFETDAGDYKYWIGAEDIAGNAGEYGSIISKITAPPDYVLRFDRSVDLSTATVVNGDTEIAPPFFTADLDTITADSTQYTADAESQTSVLFVQQEYTVNDWLLALDLNVVDFRADDTDITADSTAYTADAQDDPLSAMPYEELWKPTGTTGSIEKTVDLESLISFSKITLTVGEEQIAGEVDYEVTLSVSQDDITYTDYVGATEITESNFRYVKIHIDFTSDGASLLELEYLRLKLDVKIIADQGVATIDSGDADGTVIEFNQTFADVESIVVTPGATSARYATYNFTDAPNPTSFKALMFDDAGNRVSGPVSWHVRGY